VNFHIEAEFPVEPGRLWRTFFDIATIARLIPGCDDVVEQVPLQSYSAVMKQKIGPFRIEVPTAILVEEHAEPSRVRLRATGRDKFTGTTIDVVLAVALDQVIVGTRLIVDAELQVAGRLATLGYPVVKKRSEELFTDFERRLRTSLGIA
jgi:carbon monoxide dehydrogenase subunit G